MREALGDSDDEDGEGQGQTAALPNLSDSEDEGKKEVNIFFYFALSQSVYKFIIIQSLNRLTRTKFVH